HWIDLLGKHFTGVVAIDAVACFDGCAPVPKHVVDGAESGHRTVQWGKIKTLKSDLLLVGACSWFTLLGIVRPISVDAETQIEREPLPKVPDIVDVKPALTQRVLIDEGSIESVDGRRPRKAATPVGDDTV